MMITRSQLIPILTYNPETGVINDLAGKRLDKHVRGGYRNVRLGKGKFALAHHVAWCWVYGHMPKGGIDHINGDKGDNRLCNLRLATVRQNAWNCGVRKDSSTGLKGAFKHKRGYVSTIRVNGTRIYLGFFKTAEAAAEAYARAARIVQGQYCRV